MEKRGPAGRAITSSFEVSMFLPAACCPPAWSWVLGHVDLGVRQVSLVLASDLSLDTFEHISPIVSGCAEEVLDLQLSFVFLRQDNVSFQMSRYCIE